jgi:aldose 1-epimerase
MGESAKLITLEGSSLRVQLTNYGARIVSVDARDKDGMRADVVLGYSDLQGNVNDAKDYFGAIVGQYGNRIAKGTFSIINQAYHIPPSNNGNAPHGGPEGFSTKMWAVTTKMDSALFTLVSSDGI